MTTGFPGRRDRAKRRPPRYLSPGQGQSAPLRRGYDQAALAMPRWAAATLSGRELLTTAGVGWWNDDPGECFPAWQAGTAQACL
jgi:hypothetical protein